MTHPNAEDYKYENVTTIRRNLLMRDIDKLIDYAKAEGANEAKLPQQIAQILSDVLVFVGKHTTPEDEELEVNISSYLIPWLCDACPHQSFVDGNCVTCGAGDTP